MKIGICDDEVCVRNRIAEMLECQNEIYAEYKLQLYSPNEVLLDIEEMTFDSDILILDIVFVNTDFTGIDLAHKINKVNPMCQIIYISNCLEYALDVYETEHTYFLLKKTMNVTLKHALKMAIEKHAREDIEAIEICCNGHKIFVNCHDIVYIEREARKVNVVTIYRKYSCYSSLAYFLSKMSGNMIRTHGGYIANIEHITFLGFNYLEMKTDVRIPIGRTFEKNVREAYIKYWSDFV